MLRDTDIFVVQYVLDYLSNNRPGIPQPANTHNLWPRSPVEAKAMLNEIDTVLEKSLYSDSLGSREPDTKGRTDFIIDSTIAWAIKKYGAGMAIKNNPERNAIHAHLDHEFLNHQPVSTRFTKGEPLVHESYLSFDEEQKLDAKTKYSQTRIYKRV